MSELIERMILSHKGLRLMPYEDSEGYVTIGIGRCLDKIGITEGEAYVLFQNDLRRVCDRLEAHDWYNTLDDVRKAVLVDMAFNLGHAGLLGFKRMVRAIQNGDYDSAADEMMDSKWRHQVGRRAEHLEHMMRTGQPHERFA